MENVCLPVRYGNKYTELKKNISYKSEKKEKYELIKHANYIQGFTLTKSN